LAAEVAEVAAFLDQVPAGEEIGAKQNRLLSGFLEAEVLPPAKGAAELDIDPTPWFDVAAAVFGCTPTRWNTPTMHVLTIEAGEIIDIQDDTDQLQGCVLSPLCAGDAPEQPQSQATTD
jgi:hypothetical protein